MDIATLELCDPTRGRMTVGTVADVAALTGQSVLRVYQAVLDGLPVEGLIYELRRSRAGRPLATESEVALPHDGVLPDGTECRDKTPPETVKTAPLQRRRQLRVRCLDTGEIFTTAAAAARAAGVKRESMAVVLSPTGRHRCAGKRWEYVDDGRPMTQEVRVDPLTVMERKQLLAAALMLRAAARAVVASGGGDRRAMLDLSSAVRMFS